MQLIIKSKHIPNTQSTISQSTNQERRQERVLKDKNNYFIVKKLKP